MMRTGKQTVFSLSQSICLAVFGISCLGSAYLGYKFLSGDDAYRASALETGQRIEFFPATGQVNGKILRLTDVDALIQQRKIEAETAKKQDAEGHADEHPVSHDHTQKAPPAEEAQAPKEDLHHALTDTQSSDVEQQTAQGIIPVIAPDGTMPWQVFATKKMPAHKMPVEGAKIAVIVTELGLAEATTQAALHLPAEVALSFSAYSQNGVAQSQKARRAGHEILLDLPMQSRFYPAADPGPLAMLKEAPIEENQRRFMQILPKARYYVGMVGTHHEVLSQETSVFAPIMEKIAQHGLLYVNPGAASVPKLSTPVLLASSMIDDPLNEASILAELQKAESLAKQKGAAIIIGRAYPVTIDVLQQWQQGLSEKQIHLVPLTSLIPSSSSENH